MNYLFCSPFFYPELIGSGKYNSEIVRALVRSGAKVDVIASHPIYPSWEIKETSLAMTGVDIYRGGKWIKYPKNVYLRRAFLEIWFSWHVIVTYFRLRSPPSAIIQIFPPSLFAIFLHRIVSKNVVQIAVVHDLQGIFVDSSKGLIYSLLGKAINWVEKSVFLRCDRLIFLSQAMANHAIKKYSLSNQKCFVCYPFYIDLGSIGSGRSLLNTLSPKKFQVVYSGALGEKQNSDGLYSFMNLLAHTFDDIECHIFSDGPIFDALKLNSTSASYVNLHPLVASEDLNELYERSDIQIIPQAKNTSDGSLPSKLPNLMASGVPIFAICDEKSELEHILAESSGGIAVSTWDIHELLEKFNSYRVSLTNYSRLDRKRAMMAYVESRFSIDLTLNCINEALEYEVGVM
jgi:colanic acid biosynthesis glycosyl transferase WcaI